MSSDDDDIDSNDEEEVSGSEEEEEEEVVKPKKKKGKKHKDPNKPKRNMSAFFLYSNAHRQRVKDENPGIKFGDVAKILSTEFKSLKPKEAAKWQKLAEQDKERYTREMDGYAPPSDEDSDDGKKKKKKKKDPNAPKRNQSSFFLYSNYIRNDVKRRYPDAKFGEIAQIISREFKALPPHERAQWDQRAAEDKERYQREMEDYNG